MQTRLLYPVLAAVALLLAWPTAAAESLPAAGPNQVRNGSFETGPDANGRPVGWQTSGTTGLVQSLVLEPAPDGGSCARLQCTTFADGSPASHAMVCQLGAVGATRGQWYRFRCRVRGEGIPRRRVDVALSNTKTWSDTGLSGSLPVSAVWRDAELLMQATADVPAEVSRLQIWFRSTGSLWLDSVVFEPVDMRLRFLPEIAPGESRNLLPNSSFECQTAGWGSDSPALRTWTGNVFRLVGEIDPARRVHGANSLRVRLDADSLPVFHFDYFDALRQEIRTLVTGHRGWAPVRPGQPYVLSASVCGEPAGLPVFLFVRDSAGREQRSPATATADWQRITFTFTPAGEAVWTGVGLDLSKDPLPAATLWLDAVQLEAGAAATAYAPRAGLESFIETSLPGNIGTDPAAGLSVTVRAWNDAAQPCRLDGRLLVSDFRDQPVVTQPVQFQIGAGAAATTTLAGLVRGQTGAFRVRWEPSHPGQAYPQVLRTALIARYPHADSPLGMNHAYPWDYLLAAGRDAGLLWMRDWSVKWHTVEPESDRFDFSATDPQIQRVLDAKLPLLMLFPFPSAPWSSAADLPKLQAKAGADTYLARRYVVACPPRDDALFARYLTRSVEHYRSGVRCYEILNEPLYTSYAVPREFGYTLADYIRLLTCAHRAIKAAQPDALVVGGLGAWAGSKDVADFVEAGGLEWADVMDIHLYPETCAPEAYESDLVAIRDRMRRKGHDKPIWLTEFGCYADDLPARSPARIGDSSMGRCNWPSERQAAEALVKSTAVFLGNGVEKVFFHAGTCGRLNGDSGGGIFFDYGGTPRHMYPAAAALATELGPGPRPLGPAVATPAVRAYLFRTPHGVAAVAWTPEDTPKATLTPGPGTTAVDLMGNPLPAGPVTLTATPLYLRAQADLAEPLRAALQAATAPGP